MPIRVIGYFPTVRVTNDETVKIRKVGYQGPAGRPASDFNFSELANVADSAAPTLGNIPCGDGTLWQSVALTAALAGADPAGSAATAQAAAQAFATAADVTVLSTANSTAQGYANTAQTNAATRSDNASNLNTGTVPLPRLANITSAQLSATAGILSSQIAGLDAGKITGTFPLSLLNQGTTGQFLRGDGTYSNTLTGGLTIAGALAGATTGTFSTSVSTPLMNSAVAGNGISANDAINFTTSRAVDGTKAGIGRTTGGQLYVNALTAGTPFAVYVAGAQKANFGESAVLQGTGGLLFIDASSSALSSSLVAIGSRVAGRLNLGAPTTVVQEIGGTAVTTTSSTGLAVTGSMAATGSVSGTTGTFSGAVSGTTGAFSTSVTTPILNPSVVGGSVIVGGNLAWNASWVTDTSRNSIAQTTGGLLVINTPSANQLYIRQAGVDKVLLGDLSACYGTGGLAFVGASTTQFTTQAPSIGSRNAVTLNLNATGSVVLENGGTASLTAASSAVTLGTHSKIIYGAAGTTTAANNEIVGAVGGLRYNVASGLAHTWTIAGTQAGRLDAITTAFGNLSGLSITSGYSNSFFGAESGRFVSTGYENSALGFSSLRNCTSGFQNTALGTRSLFSCTTGSYNSAYGTYSLGQCVTGYSNQASGNESLRFCTSGYQNSANGLQSLYNCTTGFNNTGCGHRALFNLTTGSDNIGIGNNVQVSSNTGSNQINIGNTFQKTSAGVVSVDASSGGSVIATVNAATIGTFSSTGLAVAGTFSATGLLQLGGTAPATATSTGTAGQIAWDTSGNIYICSATNTWRRVATSTF